MTRFEEFKSEALNRCKSEEETKRVSEEIELFTSRGWEKYVLLVVNTIREVQGNRVDFPYYFVGSAMDSYAIRLLTTDNKESRDFLKDEKKRGILFNDAMRFSIVFHEMFAKDNPSFGIRLNNILESNIKELGLVFAEHLVDGHNPLSIGSPDTKDDLIIVSKDHIAEDDEKWILTETRKVRDGEIEILRKYLILKVIIFGGI